MLYILTKVIILTQRTGYKELVSGVDWYIYTNRIGNRSSNADMWRFNCVLPFSENFLSAFPLPKFSFYLANFCQKKYSDKNIQRKCLWNNTVTQMFVLSGTQQQQPNQRTTNFLNRESVLLSCLITEGFFPPNKSP